jgi:hypothetical protein
MLDHRILLLVLIVVLAAVLGLFVHPLLFLVVLIALLLLF